MKIYLAEMEIFNYTLTTWAFTEQEAVATLKKEWLRQKKEHKWGGSWYDKEQYLHIQELEQNQIEWR
jgi:hypothetical protein